MKCMALRSGLMIYERQSEANLYHRKRKWSVFFISKRIPVYSLCREALKVQTTLFFCLKFTLDKP